MSKISNNSKYIFKVVIVVIVVIINIIAIIGVISTVGKTIGDLRTNISTGKVSKEASGNNVNQTEKNQTNEVLENTKNEEDMDFEMDMDFGSMFKEAIKDKNVLKSLVLMAIALTLLAGAVFVLIKLK